MNCLEAQRLLHAYIDAELDVANSLEVERHLQTCPACQRDYEDYQALRAAIRGNALYFQAPELLSKRIQASLRKASQSTGIARVSSWRTLGIAAALLLCALFGIWGLTRVWPGPPVAAPMTVMTQQVFDSHMRSLMGDHLVDVASSDMHTVKPWFAGKLDFSPPVIDLRSQGFSLIGGRLDFLDNQPVAAIVYRYGAHIINFFVWPSSRGGALGAKMTNCQGYQLVYWRSYGMNCWAISDVSPGTLKHFARLIEQHTDTT